MKIRIRDNTTGTVRDYGTNRHDSLCMTHDGRYLYYKHLQCGVGSRFSEEGFSFVTEDGKTLNEITDRNVYETGEEMVNIGGWEFKLANEILIKIEGYYQECEEEYQKINSMELPADDELTFADGQREAAYKAWQIIDKLLRGEENEG